VVAAAEARRDASWPGSREQLNLAAELAQALYMVKEADRMIAFIDRDASRAMSERSLLLKPHPNRVSRMRR